MFVLAAKSDCEMLWIVPELPRLVICECPQFLEITGTLIYLSVFKSPKKYNIQEGTFLFIFFFFTAFSGTELYRLYNILKKT